MGIPKIPYGIDLNGLSYIKLVEMIDKWGEVDIGKLLNKTQKKIVEQLRQDGGYTTQKELLSELRILEKTLITNIKKLEEAGIVSTERSSTKFIYLNPAIFYFNDLLKSVREQFLIVEGLHRKISENVFMYEKISEIREKK